MNRNQNSPFSINPSVDVSRSKFDRSSSVKFSFNVGDLVPFFVDEILPGDTFQIDTHKLCRMQTLVAPIMDNLYLDTYYFFVPNRLVWDHWCEFSGENTKAPWYPDVEYEIPTIGNLGGASDKGWLPGSLADYMGIPPYTNATQVSQLYFRAYALVWNEWFRSENLQTPVNVPTGDGFIDISSEENKPGANPLNDAAYGHSLLKAGKFRDYFTSCLPSPQKGPDVLLPLGDLAPVTTKKGLISPNLFDKVDGAQVPEGLKFYGGSEGSYFVTYGKQINGLGPAGLVVGPSSSGPISGDPVTPANLWADLSNATAATVNQLRLAFQIQKIYEKDARGGTRYIEVLKNHFGVTSPDSRLQRPEYLGGNRMMININQVIQNSGTTETSPQGNTAAYSLTVDSHSDFTHSFTEHGILLGLCVARYDHSYQQGVERFWTRKNRFDFYWPSLANIGEQPVYNREIFATVHPDYLPGNGPVTPGKDNEVFGYQEAWADYRYKPSRVAGEMRSISPKSLDVWHLADYYTERPVLSDSWLQEDSVVVDRALAVTSSVANQLFADFYIKCYATRPMPLYSIPGLIDHH